MEAGQAISTYGGHQISTENGGKSGMHDLWAAGLLAPLSDRVQYGALCLGVVRSGHRRAYLPLDRAGSEELAFLDV